MSIGVNAAGFCVSAYGTGTLFATGVRAGRGFDFLPVAKGMSRCLSVAVFVYIAVAAAAAGKGCVALLCAGGFRYLRQIIMACLKDGFAVFRGIAFFAMNGLAAICCASRFLVNGIIILPVMSCWIHANVFHISTYVTGVLPTARICAGGGLDIFPIAKAVPGGRNCLAVFRSIAFPAVCGLASVCRAGGRLINGEGFFPVVSIGVNATGFRISAYSADTLFAARVRAGGRLDLLPVVPSMSRCCSVAVLIYVAVAASATGKGCVALLCAGRCCHLWLIVMFYSDKAFRMCFSIIRSCGSNNCCSFLFCGHDS